MFVVVVSQPLATLASQSPKPALHVMRQEPPEQLGVPPTALQDTPHEPQLAVEVFVSVSQPFASTPSQSAKGAVHDAISQTPAPQLAVAFGSAHAWPQAPQLTTVSRFVSHPSP